MHSRIIRILYNIYTYPEVILCCEISTHRLRLPKRWCPFCLPPPPPKSVSKMQPQLAAHRKKSGVRHFDVVCSSMRIYLIVTFPRSRRVGRKERERERKEDRRQGGEGAWDGCRGVCVCQSKNGGGDPPVPDSRVPASKAVCGL